MIIGVWSWIKYYLFGRCRLEGDTYLLRCRAHGPYIEKPHGWAGNFYCPGCHPERAHEYGRALLSELKGPLGPLVG
jgi:hypothetical protein